MACCIDSGAALEDVSTPDQVIGNGTPESCTCQAVVHAVAQGGTSTFNCGANPITIAMTEPAKIFSNAEPDVVDHIVMLTKSVLDRNQQANTEQLYL